MENKGSGSAPLSVLVPDIPTFRGTADSSSPRRNAAYTNYHSKFCHHINPLLLHRHALRSRYQCKYGNYSEGDSLYTAIPSSIGRMPRHPICTCCSVFISDAAGKERDEADESVGAVGLVPLRPEGLSDSRSPRVTPLSSISRLDLFIFRKTYSRKHQNVCIFVHFLRRKIKPFRKPVFATSYLAYFCTVPPFCAFRLLGHGSRPPLVNALPRNTRFLATAIATNSIGFDSTSSPSGIFEIPSAIYLKNAESHSFCQFHSTIRISAIFVACDSVDNLGSSCDLNTAPQLSDIMQSRAGFTTASTSAHWSFFF